MYTIECKMCNNFINFLVALNTYLAVSHVPGTNVNKNHNRKPKGDPEGNPRRTHASQSILFIDW